MALSRTFLKGLGLTDEQISAVVEANAESLEGVKAERDKFKADAAKLAAVQKELDDLKAAAEKNGKDPYKVKYEAIKEEYENFKAEQAAKETKAAKSAAYRALLKEAGISEKRLDAVLKVSDLDGIELDKDGKIKGADKLSEIIKSDWADFITHSDEKGADTKNPPVGAGGAGKYSSKDEIMKIKDPAQRQKAIGENMQLFTAKTENS